MWRYGYPYVDVVLALLFSGRTLRNCSREKRKRTSSGLEAVKSVNRRCTEAGPWTFHRCLEFKGRHSWKHRNCIDPSQGTGRPWWAGIVGTTPNLQPPRHWHSRAAMEMAEATAKFVAPSAPRPGRHLANPKWLLCRWKSTLALPPRLFLSLARRPSWASEERNAN